MGLDGSVKQVAPVAFPRLVDSELLSVLAPSADHVSVYRLLSRAFMGLPCPKKTAGMRFVMGHLRVHGIKQRFVLAQNALTDRGIGLEVRVATIEAAALCKMADRGQITGALLDGPLALDNAISPAAAAIKKIASPVAGRANILVIPDLEAGNMLAKQLEHLGEAELAGIVLGTRVPIILTSRADKTPSRLASCAIALLLAHRSA